MNSYAQQKCFSTGGLKIIIDQQISNELYTFIRADVTQTATNGRNILKRCTPFYNSYFIDMVNRIFFKDNPYPAGHKIKTFVWSGRLDPDNGLWFDFHLETEDYNAEDKSANESEPESDWRAKIVWNNYHSCIMSSTAWHYGGILVGTENNKLDFSNLTKKTLSVDPLPLGENLNFEDLAFQIYLLGHDSCAGHNIVFSKQHSNGVYDIRWVGKIALTYSGYEDFIHEFEAYIDNVKFAGVKLSDALDIEENKKLLTQCVLNSDIFELQNGHFEIVL